MKKEKGKLSHSLQLNILKIFLNDGPSYAIVVAQVCKSWRYWIFSVWAPPRIPKSFFKRSHYSSRFNRVGTSTTNHPSFNKDREKRRIELHVAVAAYIARCSVMIPFQVVAENPFFVSSKYKKTHLLQKNIKLENPVNEDGKKEKKEKKEKEVKEIKGGPERWLTSKKGIACWHGRPWFSRATWQVHLETLRMPQMAAIEESYDRVLNDQERGNTIELTTWREVMMTPTKSIADVLMLPQQNMMESISSEVPDDNTLQHAIEKLVPLAILAQDIKGLKKLAFYVNHDDDKNSWDELIIDAARYPLVRIPGTKRPCLETSLELARTTRLFGRAPTQYRFHHVCIAMGQGDLLARVNNLQDFISVVFSFGFNNSFGWKLVCCFLMNQLFDALKLIEPFLKAFLVDLPQKEGDDRHLNSYNLGKIKSIYEKYKLLSNPTVAQTSWVKQYIEPFVLTSLLSS